jgi:hypothetical protein
MGRDGIACQAKVVVDFDRCVAMFGDPTLSAAIITMSYFFSTLLCSFLLWVLCLATNV